MRRRSLLVATASIAISFAAPAFADGQYDEGASDTEIKIGNTMPYSGPASAYGTIGKSMSAYFDMINENGGVKGRRINFISLDDAYSPPKTKEQVRKLVERDRVLFTAANLGSPTNSAIHNYMNKKKIPHLFLSTGATKWGQPEKYPYTIGWQPNYQSEGKIFARYILANEKDAKIAILYQNDDFGKDLVAGLKMGLGDKAKTMIVAEESYEVSDPTINTQIINLKASGANVFLNASTPKFAAQAIVKVADIGWKPLHLLSNISQSVGSTLKPAGLDKSIGIISLAFFKDPTNPSFRELPEVQEWMVFMDKYYPEGDVNVSFNVYGYMMAQTIVAMLEQCGDNLTRSNIMKQAANMELELPLLLDGIRLKTSPEDFFPLEQMQPMRFNGKHWEMFGDVVSGENV